MLSRKNSIIISTAINQRAFSRTDLLVVILVVSVLGGFVALWAGQSRNQSKGGTCQANLKAIGMGMAVYSASNNGKIPIAGVNFNDKKFVVWDTLLYLYIRDEVGKQDPSKPKPTTADVGNMFSCPLDTLPRVNWSVFQRKRSYAMTAHDMSAANWPPGPNNKTGIGLSWGWRYKEMSALTNYTQASNNLPAVRVEMIKEPMATMAITERIVGTNSLVGNTAGSTIRTTSEQLDTNKIPFEQHHKGKFNYLMVDGHVEFLLPAQTVGHTGQAGKSASKHLGMWTIKAGD